MWKIQLFGCFITQIQKKLQQWSLYAVIEDILPIVLNTKRPLSDIWLLRYKEISFGCFQRNSEVKFCSKNTQNCFAYNSATKYRSEAVLYSKRTAGYPLSPHIKAITSWHFKIHFLFIRTMFINKTWVLIFLYTKIYFFNQNISWPKRIFGSQIFQVQNCQSFTKLTLFGQDRTLWVSKSLLGSKKIWVWKKVLGVKKLKTNVCVQTIF